MQDAVNYKEKTALVVGAGRSGLAAARFLIDRGALVILTDSRDLNSLGAPCTKLMEYAADSNMLDLQLGGHNRDSFTRCDFVVVSPGVPLNLSEFELSRKAGIPVMSEIELAYRSLKGKIIGITGSNGKTTTTALVAELINGAGMRGIAAGNIGIPLISLVEDSTPEDIYSIELSSFQLESIHEFRPFIGSVLNITPDHLDRYESFETYAAAKGRMFMNQRKTDYAVLNADDDVTASLASGLESRKVLFSRRDTVPYGTFLRDERLVFRDTERETELFPVKSIQLKGSHNLENVLAACSIAILAGVPPESLEKSVLEFKGVEHRIEFVAEIDGALYYNDSKATNVDAAIKSLESFAGNIVMIAGGRNKGGNFTLLRHPVRSRVKHLVLIGEAAEEIRNALNDDVETSRAETMTEAVKLCRQHAEAGDIILLAPACASFDMFRDYEHRGRAFKDAVLKEVH